MLIYLSGGSNEKPSGGFTAAITAGVGVVFGRKPSGR